jgi:GNAT superfamily N-acetyltransferase
VIIREALAEDAGDISLLISSLAEKYILPNCSPDGGNLLMASMTTDSIKQYLVEGYQYHVAEAASALVGAIGMKNNTHLFHLFISDLYQGQGLSKKLWEKAKTACLLRGNNGEFTVNSVPDAKGVYLKLGFVPTGGIREKNGIKDIPMQMTRPRAC